MQNILSPLFYPCTAILTHLNCGFFKKPVESQITTETSLENLSKKLSEQDDLLTRIEEGMSKIAERIKSQPPDLEKRKLLSDARILRESKVACEKQRTILINAIKRIDDVRYTKDNVDIIKSVSDVVKQGNRDISRSGVNVEEISNTLEDFTEMAELVESVTDVLGTPVIKSPHQRAGLTEEEVDDDELLKMLQQYDKEQEIKISRIDTTGYSTQFQDYDPYSSISLPPRPIQPILT